MHSVKFQRGGAAAKRERTKKGLLSESSGDAIYYPVVTVFAARARGLGRERETLSTFFFFLFFQLFPSFLSSARVLSSLPA